MEKLHSGELQEMSEYGGLPPSSESVLRSPLLPYTQPSPRLNGSITKADHQGKYSAQPLFQPRNPLPPVGKESEGDKDAQSKRRSREEGPSASVSAGPRND